jgi:hypothetical protein
VVHTLIDVPEWSCPSIVRRSLQPANEGVYERWPNRVAQVKKQPDEGPCTQEDGGGNLRASCPFPSQNRWVANLCGEILTPPCFHLSLRKITIYPIIESFAPFRLVHIFFKSIMFIGSLPLLFCWWME